MKHCKQGQQKVRKQLFGLRWNRPNLREVEEREEKQSSQEFTIAVIGGHLITARV